MAHHERPRRAQRQVPALQPPSGQVEQRAVVLGTRRVDEFEQRRVGLRPVGDAPAEERSDVVDVGRVDRLADLVQPLQVTGGPAWVSTSRFQIDARTERTTTPAQMRAMVRQMLAERFALKAHTDVRDRPIYRMVVARADGKLGPAIYHIDDAECGGSNPQPCDLAAWSGGLMSSGMGLQQLAVTLFNRSQSTGIDRLVIDQTGLAGMFGFTLMFSSSFDTVPHVSNDPSIFTALREQLGLKLEPARGPVELIVIDSVERPTAN